MKPMHENAFYLNIHSNIQTFRVGKIFLLFCKLSLMLTKAAFLYKEYCKNCKIIFTI